MESHVMTAEELKQSAAEDSAPPPGISITAQALWFARSGKWDEAHDLCQQIPGMAGSWIHAYLHREEGDDANAAYWYSRAGKSTPISSMTSEMEWDQIAEDLLFRNS